MNKGIIYLIQPVELIGTTRYKIGCSNKPNLDRCKNGYKNGSRYICIMECLNPLILERIIKTNFSYRFNLIAGTEYYEGDENEMCIVFNNLVNKQKTISKFNSEIDYEEIIEESLILKNENVDNNIYNIFPNYKYDNNFDGDKQLIHININDINIIIKYIYMKKIKEQEIKRNLYINKLVKENIIKNNKIYDLNNIKFLNKINSYKNKITIENFIFDKDIIYNPENNLIESKIKNSFINHTIINNKIYGYTNDIDINNILNYSYECIENDNKIIKNKNILYINNSYYDIEHLKLFFPICIKFNDKDIFILNIFELLLDVYKSNKSNKKNLINISLQNGPSDKLFLLNKNPQERYEYLNNTAGLIRKLSIGRTIHCEKITELLIHMFL